MKILHSHHKMPHLILDTLSYLSLYSILDSATYLLHSKNEAGYNLSK